MGSDCRIILTSIVVTSTHTEFYLNLFGTFSGLILGSDYRIILTSIVVRSTPTEFYLNVYGTFVGLISGEKSRKFLEWGGREAF